MPYCLPMEINDITRKSKTGTRTNLIEVNDNISSPLHYCLQHGYISV